MLEPVLFSIYTIELSKILLEFGVKFETFADDTRIYLTITNITATCTKLSEILTRVEAWMNFKQLKLNMNKTEYLLIGKKNDLSRFHNVPLIINNCRVEVVEKVKDLGVMLDANLSMTTQISNVVKTTSYHLRNIAFIRKYLDIDSVKKNLS